LKGSTELEVLIALQIMMLQHVLIKNNFYYNLFNIIRFLIKLRSGGVKNYMGNKWDNKWDIINMKELPGGR